LEVNMSNDDKKSKATELRQRDDAFLQSRALHDLGSYRERDARKAEFLERLLIAYAEAGEKITETFVGQILANDIHPVYDQIEQVRAGVHPSARSLHQPPKVPLGEEILNGGNAAKG